MYTTISGNKVKMLNRANDSKSHKWLKQLIRIKCKITIKNQSDINSEKSNNNNMIHQFSTKHGDKIWTTESDSIVVIVIRQFSVHF